MLNEDQKSVVAFIQEMAPNTPVAQRIKIYRGAADLINGDSNIREVFLSKAKILADAEARCAELNFTFTNGGAK